MRKTAITFMIALSLAATPVMAAEPGGFISSIPRDFVTGADFYFKTVSGWMAQLLDLLGLYEKLQIVNEGGNCSNGSRCAPGLICLNAASGDKDVYAKLCLNGPPSAVVLDEYLFCDGSNLCREGLWCTRTCPKGADCGNETHRCMSPTKPIGSCAVDNDCRTTCEQQPVPQFGPSAYAVSCVKSKCVCNPIEILPSDVRVDCQNLTTAVLACPAGTNQGCTTSVCTGGACPPRSTCLTSPAYGGTCMNDPECSDAACPEGASPFCDATDQRCRCRATVAATISCDTTADCSAKSACGAKEIPSCIRGACACAAAGVVTTCASASECSSDCPTGFGPACVEGKCACQRVIVNAPVACTSTADCGSVACPAGYDKACLDSKCSCTRKVQL